MFSTSLGRFRAIALIEGISSIALFFVAMPLKYLAGKEETRAFGEDMVSVVGMAHGVLFIGFGLILLQVMNTLKRSLQELRRKLAADPVLQGLRTQPSN